MTNAPLTRLNNGVEIPQLGFGVFQIPPDEVVEPVRSAIESGYRLIDTAAAYGNEEGVGKAIAEAGVPREELFLTTKLWNTDHGHDEALRAFDTSLGKIYADGRARAIGVSNFTEPHLRRLLAESGVVPAVNQIELHPRFNQADLRAFHAEHSIVTEAWSPIGQGQGLLQDPVVTGIARAVDRTPAQVVLRWHLQLGNVAIPKSTHAERIRANIEVFDFELTAAQMGELSGMAGSRLGPDPEQFDVS